MVLNLFRKRRVAYIYIYKAILILYIMHAIYNIKYNYINIKFII